MNIRMEMIYSLAGWMKHSGLLCVVIIAALWALTLTGAEKDGCADTKASVQKGAQSSPLEKKLARIRIKEISFEEVSIVKVVEELNRTAVKFDPEKKGVKIMLQLDKEQIKEPPTVMFTANDVPLYDAITLISMNAGLDYSVKKDSVVIFSFASGKHDEAIPE